MKWVAMIAALVAAAALAGCSEDGAPVERLIPPGDADYPDLEAPESAGECTVDADCEISCVHSCVPLGEGPETCPADPPPVPERIDGAPCLCESGTCAYY